MIKNLIRKSSAKKKGKAKENHHSDFASHHHHSLLSAIRVTPSSKRIASAKPKSAAEEDQEGKRS
jgi:hypothetical protein